MYYPAEDRIGAHWAGVDECDHDYTPTYSIPLDPPLAPKRIAAKMLQICERRGLEGDWAKSEKREPREVLDRIEELALNRDRKIIGGIGMLTAVPVVFCLAAGALAIRKQA
jgi:hypothetical protein